MSYNIPSWFSPFSSQQPTYGSQPSWNGAPSQGFGLNYGAAPDLNFGAVPPVTAATPTGPVMNAASAGMPEYAANPAQTISGKNLAQLQADKKFQQGQVAAQPNNTLGYVNAGIQGVGMLGNLYLGWQGMQQAQKAFELQKSLATGNFNNSVLDYNSAMRDREKTRAWFSGTSVNEDEVKKREMKGV